jgi:hypothetical protein
MDENITAYLAAEMPLPCQAHREKILEHVRLVLTQARVVAEQSDRTIEMLSAENLCRFGIAKETPRG